MKKTLVALTVAAFAASASAVTVYDNEGSKVDFDGSLRLAIEKNHTKTKNADSKTGHSYLKNDGSRFGVRTKHNIGEDGLFALSRLEFRFNGKNDSSQADGFGDLYAHRAYVGLGHNQYGEVTFGRQVTIADDVGEADKSYLYGQGPGSMTTAGNSVVRYDYKGVEGLQVGVNYNFATDRDAANEVKTGTAKNGYGVGALYKFNVAEGRAVKLEAGYTRDNYATGTNKRHYKDAWAVGFGYEAGALSLGLDGAQAYTKNQGATTRFSRVSVGANYAVTEKNNVFAGYSYTHERAKATNTTTRSHNYYLGTDYKLHKHVVTFVEAGLGKAGKTTDTKVGAGLRVFW
jgi:predicted porin